MISELMLKKLMEVADADPSKEKAKSLFNYQLYGKAGVIPISINLIDDSTQVIEQISFLDRVLLDKNKLVGKYFAVDS